MIIAVGGLATLVGITGTFRQVSKNIQFNHYRKIQQIRDQKLVGLAKEIFEKSKESDFGPMPIDILRALARRYRIKRLLILSKDFANGSFDCVNGKLIIELDQGLSYMYHPGGVFILVKEKEDTCENDISMVDVLQNT